MKARIFTIPWDDGACRFDDGELRGFFDQDGCDREAIEIKDHFFVHERRPVLAVMVAYRESRDMRRPARDGELRKDWRAELDAREKALYDEVRTWRARTAKRDGIPPYLILTNRQAAQVAARRPATSADLRTIEGFGEAKSSRWGEEILVLVSAFVNAEKAKEADGDAGDAPDHPALGEDHP